MKRWLIILMGLVMLAGCGSVPASVGPAAPSASQAPSVPPVAVEVPSLGVVSSLLAVGVDSNNVVETDFPPMQAAWYEHSVYPGEVGPMVILGHVDGDGQAGIFNRLDEIEIGEVVTVVSESNMAFDYAITDVAQYSKDPAEFPSELVYGNTDVPTIRLITCGGPFGTDRPGHYDDNVIAFGVLTGVRNVN